MHKLFLHTHMGLGDQIMCNALVRDYAKQYDLVYYYVKKKYLASVSYMFRDLTNIKFLSHDTQGPMNEYEFVNSFKAFNKDADHIDIGFRYIDASNPLHVDEQFYEQAGFPIENRFKDFYVKRDAVREKELFERLQITKGEYILISNESSRSKENINYKAHTKFPDAKVVYVSQLTDNMFDWVYTLINAAEIYVVESAFWVMADSYVLTQPLYVQPTNAALLPSTQNNWIKI